MARIRNIYFNNKIEEQLKKEENVSALINKLLSEYYKTKFFEDLTQEELKQELEIIRMKEKMEKQIKEIRNGRQRPVNK